MNTVRFRISAGAMLLFALAYYFDSSGLFSAVVPAALAHELGHIAALRLCARRLTRIEISLTGVAMDYAPQIEGVRAAVCILSGPGSGLLYALAAHSVGGAFWQMSGAASLLLSAFNLLPVLPLDGGRIVALLLPERQTRMVSLAAALLILGGGILLAIRYSAPVPVCMGAWLCLCNLRSAK